MSPTSRPASIALAALLLLGTGAAPAAADARTPADRLAAERVERFFDRGSVDGGLAVSASLLPDAGAPAGRFRATLQVLVAADPAGGAGALPAAASFRVSAVLQLGEGESLIAHDVVQAGDLAARPGWLYRAGLDLPAEAREVAVVVEELSTGRWGVGVADLGEEPVEAPSAAAVWRRPTLWTIGAAEAPVAAPTAPPPVFRLLPPRGRQLSGVVRFEVLVASVEVARIAYFLDGKPAATVSEPPFTARLDLGREVRPHTVRAVAYGAQERQLGEQSIDVNGVERPFRVRITGVATAGAPGAASSAAAVDLTAEVSVPEGARLDRVELYYDETLVTRLTAPPFRARVPTPGAGPQDYVRVVAYLADGSSIDDVELLGAAGPGERLDVQLVEVYAVVTDRQGAPVKGLQKTDFTLRLKGQPQKIERLSYAEDVPLVLGLVIDTSGSMEDLMTDTKQAASSFLAKTLTPIDKAFLVDFNTRPHLLQGPTGDLLTLVNRFASLAAGGYTALYDAILFSLSELEPLHGRKAVVLLTDGDDYQSQFSAARCIEYGRAAGVPVYIIGLGGRDRELRGVTRLDLLAVTSKTGGKLYFAETTADLDKVYSEINAELRSQYLLTFYASRDLPAEARRDIKVEVRGSGLTARTVVGAEREEQ